MSPASPVYRANKTQAGRPRRSESSLCGVAQYTTYLSWLPPRQPICIPQLFTFNRPRVIRTTPEWRTNPRDECIYGKGKKFYCKRSNFQILTMILFMIKFKRLKFPRFLLDLFEIFKDKWVPWLLPALFGFAIHDVVTTEGIYHTYRIVSISIGSFSSQLVPEGRASRSPHGFWLLSWFLFLISILVALTRVLIVRCDRNLAANDTRSCAI